MPYSLPSAVERLFHQFDVTTHTPRLAEVPAGRHQQAVAIQEWTWWLSHQFPRGLKKVLLYSRGRLSLKLLSSGELTIINSLATSMAGGVVLSDALELEQMLPGEHLDNLSEAILSGAIWIQLQTELQGHLARRHETSAPRAAATISSQPTTVPE